MPFDGSARFVRVAGVIAVALIFSRSSTAQTVWSGLSFGFTKANFVDVNLPENQDRITDAVWLTRAGTGGIYNIAQESFYDFASPADTEWATDLMPDNAGDMIAASNWANLAFDNWIDAYGGAGGGNLPGRLIDRDAVLHLISDDIYLDIRFTAWTAGNEGGGGGFAYLRAVPEPATYSFLLIGLPFVARLARTRATTVYRP